MKNPIFFRLAGIGAILALAGALAAACFLTTSAQQNLLSGSPVQAAAQGAATPTTDAFASPAAAITVTGIVTGPGGIPVDQVWIGVGSAQDWQEAITDASGAYTVSIQADGFLWFNVRPDLATHLVQANLRIENVTGDVVQDFGLVDGHLLDLQLTGGGAPISAPVNIEVWPLEEQLPWDQWYQFDWDGGLERYRAVLPQDIYYVSASRVPAGYYDTIQAFDLRTADLATDLPLNTTYVHPIPYDPPDATLITIGPVDDLGEATVTGTAGAALPLARVLLVNLNSTHQAHTISEADGSFAARIYAPPGSAIMIKHGPASYRWHALDAGLAEGINPFPGTIINIPHTHTGGPYQIPFAAAGAVQAFFDDADNTRNTVGAAWAISGTIGPLTSIGEWSRVLSGTYDGAEVPGLYLGGLNWTHPALSDLDDDGDLELIVGEQFGHLVLYRNMGSATTPDWQFETAEFAAVNTGGWAYPALVDVTGDGAPDLFVGTGDGTVRIYYNTGTPASPIWPIEPDVSLSAGPGAAPALDDLDGDGDLDLLVGHEGGTLFHFENVSTTAGIDWTYQSDSYGGISETGGLQPAFVDLDGDTDRDLLIGLCGQVIWYERGGTPANPTWSRDGSDPIDYGGGSCGTSPGVGNWNGAGGDDLVTGEHWGGLRFFRNDGPPTWTGQEFHYPFELMGDSAPALADWDDDGDPDLLLCQAHGEGHWFVNEGTAAAPDWRPDSVEEILPWTDHPHPFPTFADIDGDNDFDLFVGEGAWSPESGAGGNIRFYENVGTPEVPNWTLVVTNFLGLDVGGWSTPVFADIDADDDLDLFIGDEAGTITFVQNTGTATTPIWAPPVHPYLEFPPGFSAPAFFDVDQDSDLDMLVGLGSGELALVRNTGTITTPTWDLVTLAYPGIDVGERAIPTAADANGDGDPDLFIGDGDGGLNLYLYTGPGVPPPAANLYAPGDTFHLEGTIRLYSPAITATTDVGAISAIGFLGMTMRHNDAGHPLPSMNYFMSPLLTPGGFPIQGGMRPGVGLTGAILLEDLQYAGGHTIMGDWSISVQLPADVIPGTYQPHIWFDFTDVPTSTQWLGAHVTQYTYGMNEAMLPPLTVEPPGAQAPALPPPRLPWQLLLDDFVQGTRGATAREDQGIFGLASQIVYQGAPTYVPPVDLRSGQPLTYRLEPYMPMISFSDRRMPGPPLLPFDLPGGQLHVSLRQPDGTVQDLGSAPFTQSFNRTKTTRAGHDLNVGTVQLDDAYSLKTGADQFRLSFDQYGHHLITMTGVISDVWGNPYAGGGTYDLWVAQPLDIDPGVLPGTPLAVGDAFNPALQFYPRVPAQVSLTIHHFPDSDPAQVISYTLSGQANPYGTFSPEMAHPITFTAPGEIRVDLTALYTDADGTLYMGAMTWGGIVMTPEDANPQLIAHGRRGLDSLSSIPGNAWFFLCDLPIQAGAVSHTLNPYFAGDMVWSRMIDAPGECPPGINSGGDSLVLGASAFDTIGDVEATIQARAEWMHLEPGAPGSLSERVAAGELPFFISTRSGLAPQLTMGQVGGNEHGDVDQIAYSYHSSQRPGVRVRELVAEDNQSGGYWRLDTLYDDQLGVGVLGDQPNDYKFQYVGIVYRDLDSGLTEYVGQGTGWVFIPDNDPDGSRVMPPFAGYGTWTSDGGPILTLKGEPIHIFILPTGTRPGAVLEVGEPFRFAGHIMPTLDSKVAYTVTAPSGFQAFGSGQANSVGYFYDPAGDLTVDEPGLWSVDVRVWHDGQIGNGEQVLCATDPEEACPSGDVLGSDSGRTWFYVVPADALRLDVSAPTPGFLTIGQTVTPITITGSLPARMTGVTIDYTIGMAGYILEQGQADLIGGSYEIVFDPQTLRQDYPNLDLEGRDMPGRPGLADTFAIGLLLRGQRGGETVAYANAVTIQGEQVFVWNSAPAHEIYLPLMLKGGG